MSSRYDTPTPRKGPRFVWTPEFEETFFRSLCESVKMGLKDTHSFKSEAWDRACAALAERHGAYPNKGHLINKSDNARKKFRLWRGLREDPEFLYNPKTRTVTASDAAWRAHIEREPLSKSLRNRAFEHEAYLEILFPDVVGSGGAPKRVLKTKRKGQPDSLPDADDLDAAGNNVMNLLTPNSSNQTMYRPVSQTPILPPTVPSNGTLRPAAPMAVQTRAANTSSSALTPPDEEAPQTTHSRKRFPPHNNNNNNNYIDLTHSAQMMKMDNHDPHMDNPDQHDGSHAVSNNSGNHANQQSSNNNNTAGSSPNSRPHLQEAMAAFGEYLRNHRNAAPAPRWQEMAMETFFRDFADEDPDLQIRIGEKVLCDPNKAMMFCMMPEHMRKHWVKRLRELHNRHDFSSLSVGGGGGGGGGSGSQSGSMNPPSMGNAVGPGLNGNNGLMNGGGMGPGIMTLGSVAGVNGMGRNGSQVG
ncbi:hypothetical protein M406DRAFT_90507 [Cryphonectria parasitica EP155]|uniref:Myb/SANT-like domain-containing protein n=1 Tax=Cryphonectria parasitica (strain ATCC 38755 / EP155) TaxID=660469 RepID=A0A9P4Y8C1_CRYP1|nr:uncharacterized protein M406DRAFT_90507 [Cryphonectria parasitica EP155]KAF3767940.1 hypothetical protein M406DRAFT_90507 [Cryphonectria parasitica EP155]